MLTAKKRHNKIWLFVNNGCEVLIFDLAYEMANYCILRFGRLAEFVNP
jgi:hypothetical protein